MKDPSHFPLGQVKVANRKRKTSSFKNAALFPDGPKEHPTDSNKAKKLAEQAKHSETDALRRQADQDRKDKTDTEQVEEANQPLQGFRLPCRVMMLGGTGSGKTHAFIHDIMTNPNCLLGKFRRIVCFSPTMRMDPVWDAVYLDDNQMKIYDQYDDKIMAQIFSEQKAIKENSPAELDHVLAFIDDNAFNTRAKQNHEWLDKTFISGRHVKISVFCLVQKSTMMNPTQREQLSDICAWSTGSAHCIECIHSMMGAFMPKDIFLEYFQTITAPTHHYIHIRKGKGGIMQILDGLDNMIVENVNDLIASVQ